MQNDSSDLEQLRERLQLLQEVLRENRQGHREDLETAQHSYQSYLEGCLDTENWVLDQLAYCTHKHESRGFE